MDNRDHLRALHTAYVEASGIPVSLSHDRLRTLREFDRRGLTAEDVRTVIAGVKAHIARGTHGFTDASLDWRNAMANVDTFEERALKARQAKARKRKPLPVVAHTTTIIQGETVSRLAPAEASQDVPKVDMAKPLRELRERLNKGAA